MVGEHVVNTLSQPYEDPEDQVYYIGVYLLATCSRCDSVFLYEENYAEVPGDFSRRTDGRLLYPQEETKSRKEVPDTIQRVRKEAYGSFAAGLYMATAVMVRKCVEAICYELGANQGSLAKRLSRLEHEQKLDPRLVRWAHELRALGNHAAHEIDAKVDREDAIDALSFIDALIMNVFTFEARYASFLARRAAHSGGAPNE